MKSKKNKKHTQKQWAYQGHQLSEYTSKKDTSKIDLLKNVIKQIKEPGN